MLRFIVSGTVGGLLGLQSWLQETGIQARVKVMQL